MEGEDLRILFKQSIKTINCVKTYPRISIINLCHVNFSSFPYRLLLKINITEHGMISEIGIMKGLYLAKNGMMEGIPTDIVLIIYQTMPFSMLINNQNLLLFQN
jgi:hypothetical protein